MLLKTGSRNVLHRYFHSYRNLAMTFEGNSRENLGSEEERMKNVFGGRIKGDPPRSSSRVLRGQSLKIAGVVVPPKPQEPDNCCMSGCVNCVWEIYNEDLREWKNKRKEASQKLKGTDTTWPADFDPPLNFLDLQNVPTKLKSMKIQLEKQKNRGTAALFPPREGSLPQSVINARRRRQMERQEMASKAKDEPENDEGWDDIPVFIRVFAEFEGKKKQARLNQELQG
ncbi:LAME_0D09252g1_1 [Lachancea meyersii CBS 8951]|uniref:LAME_0D09252g1_1 n=1 Tax=Lachancea meyersii CBS 8951 TaxID=1266667 RepID=A0A1G4JB39_9SACH|nr:LAME_0D09252g1_1 [Lachancea meyersii CBS 8951]